MSCLPSGLESSAVQPGVPGKGFHLEPDRRLADYTTFNLGGSCTRLFTCTTPEALRNLLGILDKAKASYLLMGSGSNILVSDEGIDRTVIRYVTKSPVIQHEPKREQCEVSASTLLDQLVCFTVDHGLEGLVFCSGIPGTVGGAIVGNAGAWGQQIADALESVQLMDPLGHTQWVGAHKLGFGYRCSGLMDSTQVVAAARFRLRSGDRRQLETQRKELLAERAKRHPDPSRTPCVGSFFRNIEPTSAAGRRQSAGWFLEQAGAKDLFVGGARVFERHANIIIKSSECSAQHVYDLSRKMADVVRHTFGIQLEREVRLLGRFYHGLDPAPPSFY